MEGALTVKGLTNIRLANGRQLLLLAYHELGRTEDACKLWDVVQKLVGQNERRHTEMAESMADWARENLTCASGSGARASGSP
jgi:hypothetical protein